MESVAVFAVNILSFMLLAGAIVWVYLDAKSIGSDRGQIPGLVNTKPAAWATGTFLMLIVVVPVYLFARMRYKRQAAERRGQMARLAQEAPAGAADAAGVWPPPPNKPAI